MISTNNEKNIIIHQEIIINDIINTLHSEINTLKHYNIPMTINTHVIRPDIDDEKN